MKTIAFLTGLFTLLVLSSFGQSPTFSLSGEISDSTGGGKITNATLTVISEKDTTVKRSLLSNENGRFMIKDLGAGVYNLYVSHTGYVSYHKKILLIRDEETVIGLARSNTRLNTVNIFSEKKPVIHSADKITYNISDGAITASENLYNIILKVPGVAESNGTLFYQGKPLAVLIDNKSNNLSGEDLKDHLSGILGVNVEKLEVLLNPSSRYDAQGGVVFNIRSLKNKNYGLTENITVGAGTGTYFRAPLGFGFNYRNSKINIFGGYDYNYQKQFFLLKAAMGFSSTAATIYFVDNNIRTGNNHSVRIGFDYDVDKKTSVGFLFKGFQNYRHRDVVNNSVYTPGNNITDTIVDVITNSNGIFKSPSLNLFLKTKLSSKGTELALNADYFGYHKKWNEDITTTFTDNKGTAVASPEYLLNHSPADNSVRSATADLFIPVKNGSAESGIKLTESKTDNNVLWQQLFNSNWKTDSGKTNHFIYKEDVYASYLNISKNYKTISLQAGIRIEATRSNGVSLTTKLVTPNHYTDLFPSLSFQYKGIKDQQWSLSIRRSIRRFGFDIINPFVITQGPYSLHVGNPYIKPSYFNSVNISWSYKSKVVIGAGYSAVKDPMSYAYRKNANGNSSVGTYSNFDKGNLYSSSISYTEKIFKGKWTTVNSVNYLHSELPDFNARLQHFNNYSVSSVNNVSLPSKISMELSFLYNSPLLDGTVLQAGYPVVSMGFSKPVLKSKASLKISCTDIFDTQIFHNRTNGAGIRINAYWKPESRFVNMLFTYRFGNLNVKASKNRKSGIEEERSRMGAN